MNDVFHAPVTALLLAAGSSRRFGSDKRMARLPDGRTLLQASLDTARQVFHEVRVVVAAEEDVSVLGLSGNPVFVRSERAALGMGHSLASGVQSLADSPAQAVAILLADMPWLQIATLQELAALAGEQHIVMPVHQGRQGHPVIFGRAFWPQLERLSGDNGARSVLQAQPAACRRHATDDAGVLRDADTPAALARSITPARPSASPW